MGDQNISDLFCTARKIPCDVRSTHDGIFYGISTVIYFHQTEIYFYDFSKVLDGPIEIISNQMVCSTINMPEVIKFSYKKKFNLTYSSNKLEETIRQIETFAIFKR